jgi:hypothetical protein
MMKLRLAGAALALGAMLTFSGTGSAQVPDWPGVFDLTTVHHLNIQTLQPGTPDPLADADCFTHDDTQWPLVQQDTTFTYEVPAKLWADGEPYICVSLRRKSADPLGDPGDPKVSLKLDMNEIVPGTRWHGLRKLSLENGDDMNTMVEGVAWQLHKLAADAAGTAADFTPGLVSWVTVAVNGTEYGIYVNVEQRDKSFVQNRSIWDADHTWLYKMGEAFELVLSPGELGLDSPTQTTLCYPPFESETPCATPDEATLETQLDALIDMDVMLTKGAVEAFIVSPDGMFSKGTNYYYFDWDAPVPPNPETLKRRFLPWDLDTVFTDVNESIYCNDLGTGCDESPMQEIILGHPSFGPQYQRIMCELLAGPFQTSTLTSLVTDVETLISAPLKADPNNNLGAPEDVDLAFNSLRQYLTDRITNVDAQLTCSACTADIHCDDGNECTDDVCDLDTGFCMPPANNTNPCDDGGTCTTDDVCSDGVCTGTSLCVSGSICDADADMCVSEPVYEEFTEAQAGSTTTSLTISTPVGTVQDDLLIAVVTTDGDESASLAPPAGQGWSSASGGSSRAPRSRPPTPGPGRGARKPTATSCASRGTTPWCRSTSRPWARGATRAPPPRPSPRLPQAR